MAIYPAAVKRLIPPGPNDPRIKPRLAILHVDAGNSASLYAYFRDGSGGIESHFHVTKTGVVEQYRDTDWQADANYRANDFAVSIETQGYGPGLWTPAQIVAIQALLLWLNKTHGIPLRKVSTWDGAGVGYHVQFGAPGPWTPIAKSCPGPDRVRQFNSALVPWMAEQSKARIVPVRHRIVTANMHVTNEQGTRGIRRIVRWLYRRGWAAPDAIGIQEGNLMLGALRKVTRYQTLVADIQAHGVAAAEIPIMLHRSRKLIGTEFHPAEDGVGTRGPRKWPRGDYIVKYVKRGRKVALINSHIGFDPEQVEKHVTRIAAHVTRLKAEGYLVFVTADANAGRDSLSLALGLLGMGIRSNGVDLIAHEALPTKSYVIPQAVTFSDHDAIAVRAIERK